MQRITALILAITLLFTFGSTFVLADDAYEADSTLEESSASELPLENVVPKPLYHRIRNLQAHLSRMML